VSVRWLTAAVVAALVALASPAGATADITVNAFDDHANDGCDTTLGEDCTLREAVEALTAGQTINLPPGRYTLTQSIPLFLDKNMAIAGAGARTTTIDATGVTRIGYVSGAGVAVTVTGITVTGGDANAGDNPDIGHGGAFRVTASNSLTLNQSAVVGNVAGVDGAGISSDGGVALQQSVVSGNTVEGAGIARGGGIYLAFGGDLSVHDSTVSGNVVINHDGVARGGGIYAGDEFTLDHATIAVNRAVDGGGLFQGSPSGVGMSDTLLSGNIGGACGGDMTLAEENNNLADDVTCDLTGSGDRQGADAKLAPLGNYGGPTNTHALYTGSQAIDGAIFCGLPDQRGVVRTAPCDIGAFEGSIAPPSPPPGPPPPGSQPQQLPPPVAGKSANALPKSGTVKVKLPGTSAFVVLDKGEQIPVGTIVDATKGRVTLVAAANTSGGTATADFYGGIFKVGQTKGAKPITTLKLVEKLSCKQPGKAGAAAKKKKKRHLWGDGKGKFRTEGSYSSATVRGTKWLVQDTCTSTLTKVARGKVEVRDFVKRKTVLVKAGKKYVARRKP
jgi:CSLREA domain-containing protein